MRAPVICKIKKINNIDLMRGFPCRQYARLVCGDTKYVSVLGLYITSSLYKVRSKFVTAPFNYVVDLSCAHRKNMLYMAFSL